MGEEEIAARLGTGKVLSFTHEAQKRGKPCGCIHQRFVIDQHHGTVECATCGEVVSAFHALCSVAREEGMFRRSVAALQLAREELDAWVPLLRAVRHLHHTWLGKKMLPVCPQCKRGLRAEDLNSFVSIEIEDARRKKEQREKSRGK